MSTNLDLSGIRDVVTKKAEEMAKAKIQAIADSLQRYMDHEFRADLLQSEHRAAIEKLSGVQVSVQQTDAMHFSIAVSTAGFTEEEKELLGFYFNNAKTRALA